MDTLVFVNQEFKTAICVACECGISGDVFRHFADNHKETWKAHRKEIKAHVKTFELETREEVFAKYPPADEIREIVPGIAIHEGLACDKDECLYLTVNEEAMCQHSRLAHGWSVGEGSKNWSGCRLQTLFTRPFIR
jgi:hypothetical protein